MEQAGVKPEPRSPTPAKPQVDENSLFVKSNSSEMSSSQEQDSAKSDIAHAQFRPTWQRCDEFGLLMQVQTREKAVKQGWKFLIDLERLLKRSAPSVPSSTKWIDRISKLAISLISFMVRSAFPCHSAKAFHRNHQR